MIHHLSVSARDPKSAAEFFAWAMDGFIVDFTPNPGSFMALTKDGDGTGVEVYPAGSVLTPGGEAGTVFGRRAAGDERSPTHFALSVKREAPEVLDVAKARGWDAFVCDRGGHFHVIEVWVENTWMVEILPPAFAAEYLGFARDMASMTDPNEALRSHRREAVSLEPA